MKLRQALLSSALVIGATVANEGVAWAQTQTGAPAGPGVLEEVVVTARKREESLQNIPVAVSSVSGGNLEKQNIRQPSDLGRTVPSLRIATGTGGTVANASVTLRGQIANDILLNLSQPVGMYEDGVNIPHPVGANGSFFDLERVEVLKGPQGTLYGRNTTGGAINIITRAPDFNGLHGYLLGEIGNYEHRKYGGAVNIPLFADALAARVAYLHWNRDGYGRSRITGQRLGGDRDDDLVRVSVRLAPPDSDLRIDLKYEWYRALRNGALSTARSYNNNPTTAFEAAAYTNFAVNQPLIFQGVALRNAAAAGRAIAAGFAAIAPCIGEEKFVSCQGTVTHDDTETRHGVVDINWDATDTVRFRSLTGYHWFKNDRLFDLDGLPYQVLEVGVGVGGIQPDLGTAPRPWPTFPFPFPVDQTSEQYSQEFNLSGRFLENLDWLVGAFWAEDKGSGAQQFTFFPTFFRSLSPTGAGGVRAAGHNQLRVTNSTWALFTQNDLRITDVFSVTLGARYTEERLGQTLSDWAYDTATGVFSCTAGALAGQPRRNLLGCALDKSAKFSGTSYLASLNLQFTPSTLLYFRTARGFRGGALQGRDADAPAVAPEIAIDYELGFKSDFFDHRLRTNLAVYQTNYENKQEQTITLNSVGAATTILRNAAEARIRGLEAELLARPMEGLSLFASGSYTDAEYLSYPTALTPTGSVIDAAGVAFSLPKYQANIGFRYDREIGPGVFSMTADYAYQSKTPITRLNRDTTIPLALQKEFTKARGLVNARVEYDLTDLGLTIGAFATNLTDERYQIASIGAANAGGVANGLTQEPRMYGVSVRKTFGGE